MVVVGETGGCCRGDRWLLYGRPVVVVGETGCCCRGDRWLL